MKDKKILVAGAGGFIGGHLVADLRKQGYTDIRAVDVKPMPYWYQKFDDVDNRVLDLNKRDACFESLEGVHQVYNLAANMGGMGFIEKNKALCMLSVLINTHLLEAAKYHKLPGRFFYASSACVYNGTKQTRPDVTALKEEDAYPADAEDGYGWEKLFSERMCRHFMEDFGVVCRVARFHNVYGPNGTYDGGREKAPAAICRKVIQAKMNGKLEIEIWGDGQQTRSFMYITDCIKGIEDITASNILYPINLGSSELVSINQLVDIVENLAGVKLNRKYNLDAPKGVRGRNSDNTLINKELHWEPNVRLRDGMEKTYKWIYDEIHHVHAKGGKSVVNLT
jgi:nucleoside-diphosphate-sugar epimerase